eukprot:1181869-Prorocentrum_minimum.AAC.3
MTQAAVGIEPAIKPLLSRSTTGELTQLSLRNVGEMRCGVRVKSYVCLWVRRIVRRGCGCFVRVAAAPLYFLLCGDFIII